jgi:hypothetical protein
MMTHRLEADAEATGTMVVDEQGDQPLLAEIEDHVDDISEVHRPGIYVLGLSTPATAPRQGRPVSAVSRRSLQPQGVSEANE